MERNYSRSLIEVRLDEGGYINDPDDPGGPTNKGMTLGSFRRFVMRNGTIADLKKITGDQVAKIYRKKYWNKVRGDDLPDGLDYSAFDFAIHSGPAQVAKTLQRIVGATVDGSIGPDTLIKIKSYTPSYLVEQLNIERMLFLKRLRGWAKYKNGWSTRVSDVKRLSLEMAGAHEKPTPPIGTPFLWIFGGLILAAIAAFISVKLSK